MRKVLLDYERQTWHANPMNDEAAPESDEAKWRSERLHLFDKFRAIQRFLGDKKRAGLLTRREAGEIAEASNEIFYRAGLAGTDDSAISVAVERQSLQQMKRKILEFHPDWKSELDAIPLRRGRTP